MRLENKKIIVTAAAQGIGRATALKFASEGANVIATDINEQKLEEIKSLNPKIEIAKLDSTNKEEVENFYAKIDNIYTWAARRYDIKILTDEKERMKKFPELEKRLVNLENRVKELQDGRNKTL